MKRRNGQRAAESHRVGTTSLGLGSNSSSSWYPPILVMLFGMTIIFSILDLFLTNVALKIGLVESNYFLLLISDFSGLGLVVSLGLTKIIFVTGAAIVSVMGIRTSDIKIRKRVLVVMVAFAILLFAVSMNNAYLISLAR